MFRSMLLALLAAAACATAPVEPADNDPKVKSQAKPGWAPPEPDPKDFDWIKLNTGEWLKGEIKSMRDRDFEFDSDKLDDQKFKWKDVHEVRSSKQNKVVRVDQEVFQGTLLIKGGVVAMKTEKGEVRFKRDDVLSILPGTQTRLDYWTGRVSAGVTVRSGNTDQIESNIQVFLRRRSAFSRIDFNYIGNYGELNDSANVDNHRFDARWDYFLSQRWFLTPFSIDVYRDAFQNIDLQVTPAVGAGHRLIDTPDVEFELSLAGGWRNTRFDSVTAGQSSSDSTASIIPGLSLEWDITSDVELEFSYNAEVGVPDTADTNQHALVKLEVELFKSLDLDLTFQWDRVGDPRAEANGTVPQKDDFRTVVGLAWDF